MNLEFNDMEGMFAEGLGNYEVAPPAHIWDNIKNQKRKSFFNHYWKIATVLVLICISAQKTNYFIKHNKISKIIDIAKVDKAQLLEKISLSKIEKSFVQEQNLEQFDKINSPKASAVRTPISGKIVKPLMAKPFMKDKKDIAAEEHKNNYLENILIPLALKNKIELKYLIYPALSQHVYTSKVLFKKYIKPKIKDEKDEKLGYKFSIEILGGPSYAFRTLDGYGADLRNESEKSALSLQTGLKLNYHFNPTWSVQTGLTLENRNERINYNRTEIQTILSQKTKDVVIIHPVLPPQTITVIDSVYSDENVVFYFNSTNKYYSLNIPMVLGYNFSLGKLNYRVSAGPLFNIYSFNVSNILVRDGNEVQLVPYKESAKIKTSYYTALAVLLPINNRNQLFSEISYYSNFNNRLSSDARLSQRNFGFNISGGIKLNLIK